MSMYTKEELAKIEALREQIAPAEEWLRLNRKTADPDEIKRVQKELVGKLQEMNNILEHKTA